MDGYRVHIQDFDGPLDLLLHLIEKAEVNIEDIFVSEITAEYLSYIEELTEDELDAASDFLTVAAQLVYLKSRHLLPRPAPLEEGEEEDPEEAFIRRLKEYKIYKAAGEELSELYAQARLRFTRLPEELPPPKEEADLDDATAQGLLKAFLQALAGAREPEEKTREHRVRQDTYTVRERSGLIRKKLLEKQHLSFRELLSERPTRMVTGFSWDMLGYTQIDSILSGYAPLFGVQGISLIMFVTAAYLAYTFIRKNIVYVTVPAILMITAAPLSRFSYIEEGNPMKVALVQGNVNTTLHWDPNHIWKELQIYYDEFIANLDTEIMIWPESAIPDLEHNMEKLKVISTLDKAARSNGIGLITGIQYYDDKNRLFFNSMLGLGVIDRQKNIKYKFGEGNRYYKRHLVPIGEFVPFEWLLRQFGPIFNMPMSSFTRGSRNQPNIIIQDLKVASAICYEMAYNTELREQIYDNTNLIVTVSNDGWFNYTNGPVQHLFIARMRAREFGKPVLRATNNGITAVIDSDGRIVDTIPENITATLRTEFRPTYGETPFKKFGLMWVYLYIGSALLFAFLRKMKYKKIIASRPSQEWPE